MQKIFSCHSIDFGIREKKVSVSEVQEQKSQAANIFISDDYLQEKLADRYFPVFKIDGPKSLPSCVRSFCA